MTNAKLEEIVEAAIAGRDDLICTGQDPYHNHDIKIGKLTRDGNAHTNFCWISLDLTQESEDDAKQYITTIIEAA